MTLHEYRDLEQRTDEWYEVRRGMVTASAVGQLLTPTLEVANNETSRGLTRLLVAERISGITDPTYQNDDMFRGVVEEPRARDHYSEHHAPVTECGFQVREEDGWRLGLSPDGLVGDDGGIEIKSPRAKSHIATIIDNQVPPQYMAQVQASLLVSGRRWWDYVSWCPPLPMWPIRVLPDERWHAAIVAAVKAFEATAQAQMYLYRTRTAGLPMTERLPDLYEAELKL